MLVSTNIVVKANENVRIKNKVKTNHATTAVISVDIAHFPPQKATPTPLPNAKVSLIGPDGTNIITKSDENGTAKFPNLPAPGAYTMEIVYPPYKEFKIPEIQLLPGETKHFQAVLTYGPLVHSLSVKITAKGKDVEGALVTITDPRNMRFNSLSSKHGTVIFNNLIEGEYKLEVLHPDFEDFFNSIHLNAIENLDTTKIVSLVPKIISHSSSITITFVSSSPDYEPMANHEPATKKLKIELKRAGFLQVVETDDSCRTVFTNLPPGRYALQLTGGPFAIKGDRVKYIDVDSSRNYNFTIPVGPKVNESSGIVLKVTDINTNPLKDVKIILRGPRKLEIASITKEAGEAVFSNLEEEGTYHIYAEKKGYEKVQWMDIKVEKELKTLALTLRSWKDIYGELGGEKLVIFVEGFIPGQGIRPLSDVKVELAGPSKRTEVSSEDGKVAFYNLPKGKYELTLFKEGYASQGKRITIPGKPLRIITLYPINQ